MITRLRYLQVALLAVVIGCANRTPETPKPAAEPVTYQEGQVTLSVKPIAGVTLGKDIEITAIVQNNGSTPITLKEGCFTAIFILGGEAKTFTQFTRSYFSPGHNTITVAPNKTYEELFIVHPDYAGEHLLPGKYRMRVAYHSPDSSWRPEVNQGANRIDDRGIVESLESKGILVYIR